jgi:cytochrome c oxidase subunit 3
VSVSHHTLAHQFDSLEQQHDTSTLGMWLFLATEIMFFGGLFGAYTVYRTLSPTAFALGSEHLNIWWGFVNTVVLIGSSLTMAMAVHSARVTPRHVALWLGATILLGLLFLGIKAIEWTTDYHEGLVPALSWPPRAEVTSHWADRGVSPKKVEIFFVLYFCMTGLHALHMVVGFGVIAVVMYWAARGSYSAEYYSPVEVTGLYWHFVDIIWIFLFPLLYLIREH